MPTYARDTDVSVDRTRSEIERTLVRYGASAFMYGWEEATRALIGFRYQGRSVKMTLPLPGRDEVRYRVTNQHGGQRERSKAEQERAIEQGARQRWRALLLVIKAKLEAVEAGITTFEDEFLPYTLLPDGRTFTEWAAPQLAVMIERGEMPKLLPAPRD